MRSGQSQIYTSVFVVGLALVFTLMIALFGGTYIFLGDVGWTTVAAGGAVTAGCVIAGPCSAFGGGVLLTSTAAMAQFDGASVLTSGGSTVQLQLADAADARATGVLPHLIMAARFEDDAGEDRPPVGVAVKDCAWRSADGDSCGYGGLEQDVSQVVGDRAFEARIIVDGDTAAAASAGDLPQDRVASYSMMVPVKGGDRARFVLHVEGAPAGVWWER